MSGTAIEIIEAVKQTKESGKGSSVHLDLIRGITKSDKKSVELIADYVEPDAVEIMPGVIPKVIQMYVDHYEHIPIISSRLIQIRQEVSECRNVFRQEPHVCPRK